MSRPLVQTVDLIVAISVKRLVNRKVTATSLN